MQQPSSDTATEGRASWWLRRAMEAVTLLLVVVLPWAFGGKRAVFEFVAFLGVAALAALWAGRMLAARRPILAACPITLCLAGLFLLGAWQMTPLSAPALRTLSPGTAELNAKVLPGDGLSGDWLAAGHTLSLHPAGTQAELLRLLALLTLYAAVRSNVASAASLRRLAVVALVNGSLLSLVGLLQFFSSRPGLIYWTFQTEVAAFGAINRNEFAGYVNLCVGLGVGVLLASRADVRGGARAWDNPAVLWAGAGLVLMLTAVGLCQSRGGLCSLLGAVAVVALIARGASGAWRVGVVLLLLGLALGVAAWFGLEGLHNHRLAGTLRDGVQDERWEMWLRTVPFARTFPVFGSGFGTYSFLECLSRPPHAGPDFSTDYAHNEYLNVLLEGGVVGLGLALAAVTFAYLLGVRGVLRHRQEPAGGLALGGLFALSTIVLHNVVDFGMHLPAIAALTAVVMAHLAALGSDSPQPSGPSRVWALPRLGVAVIGAAALLLIAWILVSQGHTRQLAERYRNAAERLEGSEEPGARQRRLDYLRSAADLRPADAEAQQSLANALFEAYRAERSRQTAAQATLLLGGPTWAGPGHAASALALADVLPGLAERRLGDVYLRPARRLSLTARSLCPFLPTPHVCLAAYGGDGSGEPASAHLARACVVKPFDAELWFVAGAQQLREGEREQAWRSWRRSLECSAERLEEIVARGHEHLGPEALATAVLPDDPDLVYRAALLLGDEEARRPVLERAVEIARRRSAGAADDVVLVEARSLARLGRTAEAAAAFERLASRAAEGVEWRYEYAQALHGQGRLEEARRELRLLLQQQPDHRQAADLQREVARQLSEGR